MSHAPHPRYRPATRTSVWSIGAPTRGAGRASTRRAAARTPMVQNVSADGSQITLNAGWAPTTCRVRVLARRRTRRASRRRARIEEERIKAWIQEAYDAVWGVAGRVSVQHAYRTNNERTACIAWCACAADAVGRAPSHLLRAARSPSALPVAHRASNRWSASHRKRAGRAATDVSVRLAAARRRARMRSHHRAATHGAGVVDASALRCFSSAGARGGCRAPRPRRRPASSSRQQRRRAGVRRSAKSHARGRTCASEIGKCCTDATAPAAQALHVQRPPLARPRRHQVVRLRGCASESARWSLAALALRALGGGAACRRRRLLRSMRSRPQTPSPGASSSGRLHRRRGSRSTTGGGQPPRAAGHARRVTGRAGALNPAARRRAAADAVVRAAADRRAAAEATRSAGDAASAAAA